MSIIEKLGIKSTLMDHYHNGGNFYNRIAVKYLVQQRNEMLEALVELVSSAIETYDELHVNDIGCLTGEQLYSGKIKIIERATPCKSWEEIKQIIDMENK